MAKREEKLYRIKTFIANLPIGETITMTTLAKRIGVHPYTLKDVIDMYDSLKEVGFETLRDKNGNLREIMRTNESLNLIKEVREIRKEQINQKNTLDEIKHLINSKK